jgi:hypothetical protein
MYLTIVSLLLDIKILIWLGFVFQIFFLIPPFPQVIELAC